ncbi:MAG TPA: hypothetical protein DD727_01150 [Clostridiales bacterium]|nr:hypothetical protein [Clostridiales bacterium]
MKKVLLIGDSIRIGYQPEVQRQLAGIWEVAGPKENCMFSGYTLKMIRRWLEEFGPVDVVHWNNGIWDVGRHTDGEVFTPLPYYLDNLTRTLRVLKSVGIRVVWASTTPVNDAHPNIRNADILRYNCASGQLMADNGIPVNDLHAVVSRNIDMYISGTDFVHLSPEGVAVCAEAVGKALCREGIG